MTITSQKDFEALRQKGLRWVTEAFTIRYIDRPGSDVRFGLSAGKKMGTAVIRNRARRRLREAFRLHAETKPMHSGDYLLSARPQAVTKDFQHIQRDLEWALSHLERLARERKEQSHA
ncbi:ribonuclease P protein component [Candidatus Nucleicultrix amoebiphila]|uniref:ribonuclease P protein component n=1 Tax=Candidatus Nucleicultrix amoebiphila TaxID=1509244 RepID=UPI0018DEA56C|nr:ribonuclease P protein component [Candidatus Nucleicultrix amoebiphila]